jgi:hypothetical protein
VAVARVYLLLGVLFLRIQQALWKFLSVDLLKPLPSMALAWMTTACSPVTAVLLRRRMKMAQRATVRDTCQAACMGHNRDDRVYKRDDRVHNASRNSDGHHSSDYHHNSGGFHANNYRLGPGLCHVPSLRHWREQ